MPTTRRRRKRHRLPQGFAEINKLEQTYWAVGGPIIAHHLADPAALQRAGVTVWESWEAWAEFYATIRKEYLSSRHGQSVPDSERLFAAVQRGDDPDAVHRELAEERRRNDPRKTLGRR